MCSVKNDGDTQMPPKEWPYSSSNDEGNRNGSPRAVEGPVLIKGPWTSTEDDMLIDFVKKHGERNWNAVQRNTRLRRSGKSCRLRWVNQLRPDLKKGALTREEEQFIIRMHTKIGNSWAQMAAHLPGRTDNAIKNFWNTQTKRRRRAGLLPHAPINACSRAPNENQLIQSACEFFHAGTANSGGLQHAIYEPTYAPAPPLSDTHRHTFTSMMELPSLQSPETNNGDWITCSDRASPRCDGLLEALVRESWTMNCGKNESSEWEVTGVRRSPAAIAGNSLLGFPPKAASGELNCLRPFALIESDWVLRDSYREKEASAMSRAVLSLGSCSWNSLPSVCQMPENR